MVVVAEIVLVGAMVQPEEIMEILVGMVVVEEIVSVGAKVLRQEVGNQWMKSLFSIN
jgi:hypothetical protein